MKNMATTDTKTWFTEQEETDAATIGLLASTMFNDYVEDSSLLGDNMVMIPIEYATVMSKAFSMLLWLSIRGTIDRLKVEGFEDVADQWQQKPIDDSDERLSAIVRSVTMKMRGMTEQELDAEIAVAKTEFDANQVIVLEKVKKLMGDYIAASLPPVDKSMMN